MVARAMGTKVSCNKEGNGNKDGGQAMATVRTWAMATATRLAGNKEGKCKGGKGNANSNEGGW